MFSTYSCLTLGRVDAFHDERAAALPVEERAEDEARVGPRPAQPLHRSVAEEGVVRAVSDDPEAVCHRGVFRRRVGCTYLPALRLPEGGALAKHTGHHALVIASNRLPVRFTLDRRRLRGAAVGRRARGRAARQFAATQSGSAGRAPWCRSRCSPRLASSSTKKNLVPIFLSADEEEDFYGRVCNDTLWPLFHYFSDRLRITPEAWQHYVRVNERFADAILEHSGPDSRVWIHDFHLMLVPAMLRRRAPRALGRLLPAHAVPVVGDLPPPARA